jgi:hypothetical protein
LILHRAIGLLRDENKTTAGTFSDPLALFSSRGVEPISKLKNDSLKNAPYARVKTSSVIFPMILQFIHGSCDMLKLFPRR